MLHSHFCHISSHGHQGVSVKWYCSSSARQSHSPMTNSEWVILRFAVSSHLIPALTECQWHCPFLLPGILSHYDQQYVSDTTLCPAMQSHHISSHEQQRVSDTALFLDAVMADLIWINSMWVILPFFLLGTSHLMTNRMCVTPLFFSVKQSHHSSFHDKQAVSDTIIFCLPASVITSHSIWTNREWVVSPFISSR